MLDNPKGVALDKPLRCGTNGKEIIVGQKMGM